MPEKKSLVTREADTTFRAKVDEDPGKCPRTVDSNLGQLYRSERNECLPAHGVNQ